MLWGLYRLSNDILGGRPPKGPPKGPKPQALYGGKTASPKKEGKFNFAWSSVKLIALKERIVVKALYC